MSASPESTDKCVLELRAGRSTNPAQGCVRRGITVLQNMPRQSRPLYRHLLVSLVSIGLSSFLLSSAQGAGRHLALLVGINHYDNRNLSNLEYAERDVDELARMLRPSYQVQLLSGAAATKVSFVRAFDQLLNHPRLTKDDTVLIALAGHGLQLDHERNGRKRQEPFFCPRDAVPSDSKTMVNLSVLMERLGERGGGTNMLLVDACRNDSDPTRGRGIDGDVVSELPLGMAVFFSCSKGEKAQESAKAGGGHGLFFHFVLEALKSKEACNHHGQVTWHSLVAYVHNRMEEEGPKLVGSETALQTPHDLANLRHSPVLLTLATPAGREHNPDVLAHYNRGNALLNKNDYDKAIEEFSQAIRLDPKYPGAYHSRGRAWEGKRDTEKAIADYTEAIRVDPKFTQAYVSRNWLRRTRKEYDKAIEEFNEFIRLNPKSAIGYLERGYAWRDRGDTDKAIADFTEAVHADPHSSRAYMARALARRSKKEYEKAAEDYSQLIHMEPKSPSLYIGRGYVWLDKKDYDKAIADYTEAIRLNPKYAYAYVSRGSARRETKEYEKAIGDYTEAIRLDAKYAYAYVGRGNVRREMKDYEKAIGDYTEAINVSQNYFEGHRSLAWLLATCPVQKYRDGHKAIEQATKACELTRWNNSNCLDTLSAAYAETKNFKEAINFEHKSLYLPYWDKQHRDEAQERLKLYEQRRPYHER
jgi:tetratricopeptide (TPR) repeat protein